MFENCLKHGWAVPAKAALDLFKMVKKRMYSTTALSNKLILILCCRWKSMTPLCQFKGVLQEVIRTKAEDKKFVSFIPDLASPGF